MPGTAESVVGPLPQAAGTVTLRDVIQIFGTKKSRDTQKAVRFFKERRIPFQLIDLTEKAMSRGELESVARSVPVDALLDRESALYKKLGLEFQVFDPIEKLLEQPSLFHMPVVRDKHWATAGPAEEEWRRRLEG